MRLAQLARKLALRPADITDFLSSRGITISEGSNARMDDEHVRLVIDHFDPSLLDSVLSSDVVESPETAAPEVEPVSSVTPEPDIEVIQVEETPEPAMIIMEEADADTSLPEVIKAPKVALPGLKVVGKIDLPEPKKKEEPAPEEPTEVTDEQPSQPQTVTERKKNFRNKKRPERERKNPVALQREREARAAEKKRREEEKREKEKRRNHYLKKVKPAVPTKRASLIHEEDFEVMTKEMEQEQPKSAWGRFMKWLRRE